jgi:hypothetical protein
VKQEKINLPAPIKQAIERLSLPQALMLQGILLDHSMKLIGLSLEQSPIIKPSDDDLT